jgi:type I restriction enzyme S subunit
MSWKKVKLGDLCVIEKGKTGIQKAISGEYPLVVTAEDRKSHNEYQFDDEAVIIPLVSGTGHGHASIKRLHFQSGKFALGSILCAVIPKDKSILNAEYLFRFLNLNKERELVDRMKGMANVTLPIKEIAKIEIPLPTLDEQIEFVEKYGLLETDSEDISSELDHQLDLIKQLRQAFLREAMQGKLVKSTNTKETGQQLLAKIKAEKAKLIAEKKLKKEKELPPITEGEIPFEIPEHWAWCRLGEIISYTDNLDIHKNLPSEAIINYVDIASIDNKDYIIKEVKKSTVSQLSTRARRVLKKDYIIYSTVRPYLKNIAIIQNELPNFIGSTGFNVFKPINSNIKYLFYFLLNPDLNKKYEEMMVGFNSPSITNGQFENTSFPLPPLHEQEQIVAKLEELMAFCDGLEQSIKESQEYNEMLLQQVLREALQGEATSNI